MPLIWAGLAIGGKKMRTDEKRSGVVVGIVWRERVCVGPKEVVASRHCVGELTIETNASTLFAHVEGRGSRNVLPPLYMP